jgi:hypothetical protein
LKVIKRLLTSISLVSVLLLLLVFSASCFERFQQKGSADSHAGETAEEHAAHSHDGETAEEHAAHSAGHDHKDEGK